MPIIVNNAFKVTRKDLGSGNELCMIEVEEIDAGLKACLDEKFIRICEGNSGADLPYVKNRLISFLATKKGTNIETGAIAEFFIHTYLNEAGFEPQFLFFNLEERSIKKGFDGYYLHQREEWFVESKSGSITTDGISHRGKIKESYDDLKDKLAGGATNNPWLNAYNHASHMDVKADATVREHIKAFTKAYEKKTFHDIADFNIIPGSTIFLDGGWVAPDMAALEIAINELITGFDFKKIRVLCTTKKSIQLFWDYLNST